MLLVNAEDSRYPATKKKREEYPGWHTKTLRHRDLQFEGDTPTTHLASVADIPTGGVEMLLSCKVPRIYPTLQQVWEKEKKRKKKEEKLGEGGSYSCEGASRSACLPVREIMDSEGNLAQLGDLQ